MDLTPTTNTTTGDAAATATTIIPTKSPDPDSEPPTRIQPTRQLSLSNGFLKRHHHNHHLSPPVMVSYKECLKNHAATLGGHALDGCGEFMPSPSATATDPTSLKCAACGCHRNFHRREPREPISPATTHVIEYQPHHRHHPPPPPPLPIGSPNSASPPPISSAYYPSAPHMLLALSAGVSGPLESANAAIAMANPSPLSRKRFRTKFSQNQKEKMYQFAENVGWKMQKRDEELVQEFCNEIGVDRSVLKVWMHNNKNTLGKKDINGNRNSPQNDINNSQNDISQNIHDINLQNLNHHHHMDDVVNVAANGSSSSS